MNNPLKNIPEDDQVVKKTRKYFNIAIEFKEKLNIKNEDDWLNLEEACKRYIDRTMEGSDIAISNN